MGALRPDMPDALATIVMVSATVYASFGTVTYPPPVICTAETESSPEASSAPYLSSASSVTGPVQCIMVTFVLSFAYIVTANASPATTVPGTTR